MTNKVFRQILLLLAALFTGYFSMVVVPPLLQDPDIFAAFAAGFVNPYASGYAADTILCWFVLATWVIFEKSNYQVRHGWICLCFGVVPGVAVGFALYLFLRQSQLNHLAQSN